MTAALIGITVGFYIITLFSWSLNLAMLFYAPLAFAEPWRFVTAALLHSGMIHLFFNMYSLWLLGGSVEPAFGKWNFLGLYVFSAITGNLFAYGYAVLTGGMNLILVGASGAIFGLFGALLVLTRHINGNTTGILIVLGINLLIGVTNPQISWQAHIGGFIGVRFTLLYL
ncbi:rhomboid family intramembrane serine protease [Arcanobacterium hippocoleae]